MQRNPDLSYPILSYKILIDDDAQRGGAGNIASAHIPPKPGAPHDATVVPEPAIVPASVEGDVHVGVCFSLSLFLFLTGGVVLMCIAWRARKRLSRRGTCQGERGEEGGEEARGVGSGREGEELAWVWEEVIKSLSVVITSAGQIRI